MLNTLKARPRLLMSIFVTVLLWFALPEAFRQTTRLLVAWDVGSLLYLILVANMMMHSDTATIRCRASAEDDGQLMILALTTFTAIASLAAIVLELASAKDLQGWLRSEHIALAAATVFLSWTFMQTIFALQYAHEFYGEENGVAAEGLEFPGGDRTPDYWDFIYYSFVIGCAAQTADVNITSGLMRKITTIHCMIAFFFNTTILALTINIGAGLLG